MFKRLWFALCALTMTGCSTMGNGQIDAVSFNNILMPLISAATGVALNRGTAVCPALPPEALNPCQPAPLNATPEQMQATLNACVTNSVVLVALERFRQKVCTPSTGITP